MEDWGNRDRAAWERIFAAMPAEWYEAPPSDAMRRCRAYFDARPCARVLDLGCGFGRWAHFLAGHGVGTLVGMDYAERGVRAASAWAGRAGFDARFVVGSATAIPFRGRPFDGVLAALVLDNLTRPACVQAVRELNSVVRTGARGFFVFSPVLTPEELSAVADENPTKGCTHVAYADGELTACVQGWAVTAISSSAERLRLVEATFRG